MTVLSLNTIPNILTTRANTKRIHKRQNKNLLNTSKKPSTIYELYKRKGMLIQPSFTKSTKKKGISNSSSKQTKLEAPFRSQTKVSSPEKTKTHLDNNEPQRPKTSHGSNKKKNKTSSSVQDSFENLFATEKLTFANNSLSFTKYYNALKLPVISEETETTRPQTQRLESR